MYVTRRLSEYRKSPESLSLLPPEGPNSGILVIDDEESESKTRCFGLLKNNKVREFPFPQNKNLELRFSYGMGPSRNVRFHSIVFVPVLNQPLSKNQYYAVKFHGRNKGEVYTSSKEEDKEACCFFSYALDKQPLALDPNNMYQQLEMHFHGRTVNHRGGFVAKSVASDGIPPAMLRKKGWQLYSKSDFKLSEALGIDSSLRDSLPKFNFPLTVKNSKPVIVGTWYCPFMFIKEGILKYLMNRTMYYEMTLEQNWEQIYHCENSNKEGNSVTIDTVIERESVWISGKKVAVEGNNVVDGVMWFRDFDNAVGDLSVGLNLAIIERMKWEEERVGWVCGDKKQGKENRVEVFGGKENGWENFGFYVLVEKFVLKRMDGSVVLTYSFKHSHQTRCIWE